MTLDKWPGQREEVVIEIDGEQVPTSSDTAVELQILRDETAYQYDEPDKTAYLLAASCGFLTGILDSIWVGSFSLSGAQTWGREQVNQFVIKVAQMRGYGKNELEGALRFLGKDAPIPSD